MLLVLLRNTHKRARAYFTRGVTGIEQVSSRLTGVIQECQDRHPSVQGFHA